MARAARRGADPTLRETARTSSAPGRASRGALFVAALLALLPSCASVFPTGPTPVAQGKYYGSGDAEFDTFFIELYRTQVKVGTMPGRLSKTRNDLTDALGVSRELSTEALTANVEARARDLSRQGVLMKLELGQSAVLLTRPQERGASVRQLAEPIEKAANELVTASRELDETSALLDRLDLRRAELYARASATFGPVGPVKVSEVERNLDDARQVIVVMRARVSEHRKQTDALLEGLARASDTSRGAFARPPPAPEEPAPAPTKRGQARATAKPKGQSAPKAAAPSEAKPKSAPKAAPSEPAGFEP